MSHLQDIERIVESLDSGRPSISDERALIITRAALASAQRDRYKLENRVNELLAEVNRLSAAGQAGERAAA